jgi:hypothetical protein
MRGFGVLGTVLLVGALGGFAFLACGTEAEAPVPTPSPDASAPVLDSGVETSAPRPDAEPEPDIAPPRPASVPEGWELSGSYRKKCGFYVPTRPEQMPEPIRWRACTRDLTGRGLLDGGAGDGGLPGCREMEPTWVGPTRNMNVTHGTVDTNGKVLLSQVRVTDGGIYYVLAEADGPVRTATLTTLQDVCTLYPEWISQTGELLMVRENGLLIPRGIMFASAEGTSERPTRKLVPDSNVSADFFLGTTRIAENNGAGVHIGPLSTLQTTPLPPWSERFGKEFPLQFVGDGLVFRAEQGPESAVFAYTKDNAFVSLVDDKLATTGEDSFGTDGKDAAWLHSTGCTSSGCASVELRTAPFALAPLTGRRVREMAAPGIGLRSVVGCGRAAFASNLGLNVVDLTTGQAWLLPQAGPGYYWSSNPYALTCDELFATAAYSVDGGTALRGVRIRLDALGPGSPAN